MSQKPRNRLCPCGNIATHRTSSGDTCDRCRELEQRNDKHRKTTGLGSTDYYRVAPGSGYKG